MDIYCFILESRPKCLKKEIKKNSRVKDQSVKQPEDFKNIFGINCIYCRLISLKTRFQMFEYILPNFEITWHI